ncbi:NAD-dependent epimerase/dehydratase family protein [Mycolicibacterium vaccae]|uniref:NAD-dependent epimerase/dehydratase family protein n=1 Tax=Mycolicibacterium vaccae TaxID=1810 RepID=UPI003CEB1088
MTHVGAGSRIAVTGVTGFVGEALVLRLVERGHRVVGISQPDTPPETIAGHLESYHSADLTECWPEVGALDGLIHLAGLSSVGPSFDRPQDYIQTNSAIVTQLFEDALARGWKGRAVIVSSGAVYGGGMDESGLNEDSAVLPTSPYVVSKLLIENQTAYYRLRGVDALVVRPFNHIGPGQKAGFIVPDLVEKIVRSKPGEAIYAGNLVSSRDYTDVRDVVDAYRLLLEHRVLEHHTYNICSGRSRSGREVLRAVCNALGRSVPDVIQEDQRAIDPSHILGDATRIRRDVGWAPKIELQTSIDDFVSRYVRETSFAGSID